MKKSSFSQKSVAWLLTICLVIGLSGVTSVFAAEDEFVEPQEQTESVEPENQEPAPEPEPQPTPQPEPTPEPQPSTQPQQDVPGDVVDDSANSKQAAGGGVNLTDGLEGEDEDEEEDDEDTTTFGLVEFEVTFMLDAQTEYRRDTVKEGELVPEPAAPSTLPEGMRAFTGWYDEQGNLFNFAETIIDDDITLMAGYSTKLVVQFKVDGVVVDSQEVDDGGYATITGIVPAPPANSEFMHWYVEGAEPTVAFDFANTPITKNTVLVPYFANSYHVYFISGGSDVASQVVLENDTATEPSDDKVPTRVGYDFLHWSLEVDGEAYDFSTPITGTTILYGVWTGGIVDFTVTYWVEKANLADGFDVNASANYDFAYTETRQGVAGSTVTIEKDDADAVISGVNNTALKYSHYSHSREMQILGNGNTVVNVFYLRNEYEITFDMNPIQGGTASMDWGGQTYSAGNSYVLTVKYEQDVSETWPVLNYDSGVANFQCTDNEGVEYDFIGWQPESDVVDTGGYTTITWVTRRDVVASDMLPIDPALNAFTVYAQWEKDAPIYHLNYMFQLLDTEEYDNFNDNERNINYLLLEGHVFKRDESISQYITTSNSISSKAIEGFTAYGSTYNCLITDKGQFGTEYSYFKDPTEVYNDGIAPHKYLLYSRNYYKLTFNPMDGINPDGYGYDPQSYMYEQPFEEPTEPYRQGYIFAGWYYDSEYTDEVDFETATMPARDVIVYASWEPEDYSVTFYDGVDGNVLGSKGIELGGYVTEPDYYVVDQAYEDKGEFIGWYWYPVKGEPYFIKYNFETVITGDVGLYAAWRTDGFIITYDTNGGTGADVTDITKYALNQLLVVKDGSHLTKGSQRFIGWEIVKPKGDSNTYYKDNSYKVYGSTTFVAKYTEPGKEYYTLTYHSNGGDGYPITRVIQSDVATTLLGADTFTRYGYQFLGWDVDPDGQPRYAPGSQLNGDSVIAFPYQQDIDLYAMWGVVPRTVTFKAGANGRLFVGPTATDTHTVDAEGFQPWEDSWVPMVKPDEGYYFAGWDDEFPDYVERDLVFTAIFRAKTDITITAGSAAKTYDGTPLSFESWELTSGDLTPGDIVSAAVFDYSGDRSSITEAGQTFNRIDAVTITRNGWDVTSEYRIKIHRGLLTVTPAPVIIAVDSTTKQLGESDPAFTATVAGLVGGDDLNVQVMRDAADADKEALGDVIALTATYDANPNYDVTVEPGTLTITDLAGNLTVSAADVDVVYNGQAHSTAATSNRQGATILYADASGNYVLDEAPAYADAGSYVVRFMASLDQYNTAYGSALINIERAPLAITAASHTITEADAIPALTYTAEGFVNGEAESVLDGSIQLSTSYTIGAGAGTYGITIARNVAAGNYDITYNDGTLTVTATSTTTTPGGGGEEGGGDGGTTTGTTTPPGGGGGVVPAEEGDDTAPIIPIEATAEATIELDDPTVEILDPDAPLAAPPAMMGEWSVLNLMVALIGLMIAVVLGIYGVVHRRKDGEADEEDDQIIYRADAEGTETSEEDQKQRKIRFLWHFLGLIGGALLPIVFLLTEDISKTAVFVDRFTPLMLVIFIVQVVSILLYRYTIRRNREEDDIEDVAEQV